MRKIPDFTNNTEFNIFYESENLENTEFVIAEDINPRRPDAYIGFNNSIFSYPHSHFNEADDLDQYMDLEWY